MKKKVTQEGQGEEGLGFLRSVGLLFPSKVKGKSKRKCKGKALLLRAQSRPRDWLAVFPFSLFFSCWFSPRGSQSKGGTRALGPFLSSWYVSVEFRCESRSSGDRFQRACTVSRWWPGEDSGIHHETVGLAY